MSEVKFSVSVDVLSKVEAYLYKCAYGEVKGLVSIIDLAEVDESNATVVRLLKEDAEAILEYMFNKKYREVYSIIGEFKTDISLHIQAKEAAAKEVGEEGKNARKSKKAS